ncbi:M15 family metallopeptidase [Mycolicibacterium sp. XJ870]
MRADGRAGLRRWCAAAIVAAAGVLTVQCSSSPPAPTSSPPAPTPSPPAPTPSPPAPTPAPPETSPPASTTTPTRAPVPATVHPVATAELGATWRPGCPVGPELLSRVELNFVGSDGQTHRGSLVVHKELVREVIAIFDELYRQRYPIATMRTVDHYPGAEDELSMRDNNTSAFNCRGIPGSRSWSLHAYGRAIDVNPLVNPYIDSRGGFQPANAAPYLDRTRTDPGMLRAGDPAVRVFTDRGWRWGGYWRSPIDYQHFEMR